MLFIADIVKEEKPEKSLFYVVADGKKSKK